MQAWARESDATRSDIVFLLIIIKFDLTSQAITIVRTVIRMILDLRFSKKLVFNINMSLLYASVNKFWDRVPIGRVINRVASDTSIVEVKLSRKTYSFFTTCTTAVQQFILVTYTSSQWLWFAIFFNLVLCLFSYRYFMKAKLETQRTSQILRTPINQLFNESLNGLTTIRVFGKEEAIMKEFYNRINKNRS